LRISLKPLAHCALVKRFSVIVEGDEDGYYVASVPELPGCYTQARTLDELVERVKEAIELYLEIEGSAAEGRELVGVQFIEVAVREPEIAPSR
jgi:predicted RNase H-like HicB family nuclease